MQSHFQILLRGVLGVVRKSGRGTSIFVFYCTFKGVHKVYPSPLCGSINPNKFFDFFVLNPKKALPMIKKAKKKQKPSSPTPSFGF
jgi:hypothetical protein